MKVQKLTLENVKKIKNETNNKLTKCVCDYIVENWNNYEDKKDIFLNIMRDGCKSGACSDLTYYSQTKNFYETYKYEINELLYKSGWNNLSELFGKEWDKTDLLALEDNNKNLLAWFGFEETLTNIAYKFGIE